MIFFVTLSVNCVYSMPVMKMDDKEKDTTIVGQLLDCDSIFIPINNSRAGTRYYYGVHHLKLAVINTENKTVMDTLIVAYVYNVFADHAMYVKNFKLKKGDSYIFDISDFSPCHSDFPKIQGRCDEDGVFLPISNKLINKYKHLYRVINSYKYLPE